jgi:hypothetical protein
MCKALKADGKLLPANLAVLDADGMNKPYVLEGKLPAQPGQ